MDFQISYYGSPAFDILFHTFSSTRKELRDQSYTDLLRIYHSTLSETVRKLGSDPQKLFSFSDLMDELKAHGRFGLLMGVLLMAFVVTKPDEMRDMDEYIERYTKGENVNLFLTSGEDSDVYTKVVNDLVGDIIAYGYVQPPTNER